MLIDRNKSVVKPLADRHLRSLNVLRYLDPAISRLKVSTYVKAHDFKKALRTCQPRDFCDLCSIEMAREVDAFSAFTCWEWLACEDRSLKDHRLIDPEREDHSIELQIQGAAIDDQKP